jgi:hypothetical protein
VWTDGRVSGVQHFIRFTWEGFWRAFPMYATLHSVTTVLFLLLKMRSFIVARGYHRSLPPVAEKREDDDNGDENNDEGEEEEEQQENRQRKTMHTRASGQEASLALNRDHSMRALHRRRRADDGGTPDCQEKEEEEEEEEEEEDDEGVEGEVENKGGSASSRTTRKTCTNGGFRKSSSSSSSSSSKQRLPRGQGVGRMVVCCIRNLWVHLRSPDQNVLALLRFLFTQVLPKIALNIAR